MTHPITHGPSAPSLYRRFALLMLPLLLAACATPGGSPTDKPAPPPVAAQPETPAVAAAAPAASAASAPAPVETAAAAPVPVDPLRPEVRLDMDDRAAQTDLWERVRRGFTMPDLDTDLVRNREQWYATRPDYVQRMTERGGRYMFYIVEELDKRGMPTELALLPFIESAYNPQAMSTARASGMWQFIPGTGKDYALKQNIFRDDRRDVLQSTRAALDYMQKLYAMFGDWHLALAAYNWGEGSVQRAIAKNQKLGLPTDYLSLKMPNETQYYVPKLQAVKNIIARPSDFNLTLPPLKNHPYFLSVPIERDMDVAVAVKLAGMPLEEFQFLNPQMNKPVILAAGTPQVLLPYDNANQFVRRLPQHRGPLASWTAWVAPKTLRPAEAAKQVGMSEAQLREINRIPPRMLVKAGSTLLVPRGEQRQADVSSAIADNAMMALAPDVPPLRKMSLKAGRRDSVASVAKRYRVSPTQVAQWNSVGAGASFKPGQTIVVFVAAKSGKPAHANPTRTASNGKATRTAAHGKSTRTAATTRKPSGPPSTRVAEARRKGASRTAGGN
ncbi:transglycosylase SLT domain-containing protein [Rhizobacter sp. Root404]|uniref:transglycosylase SLT domain-containing protein n=1 Tax=Rhizobacter sp. Root404 TaxID=1736528 RepID=UPI0006FBEFA4|nr:transglycosylase SLT domain-containing protein [Rhizobacter sp. Root404]KQW36347.1 lytic transglycosylase [Rhizobacter sp. Root404]